MQRPGAWRFLWDLSQNNFRLLVGGTLLRPISETLQDVLLPLLLAQIIQQLYGHSQEVWIYFVLYACVQVGAKPLQEANFWCADQFRSHVPLAHQQVLSRLMNHGISFFVGKSSGEISARIDRLNAVHCILVDTLSQYVSLMLKVITVAVVMILFSPVLGAVFIGLTMTFLAVTYYLTQKRKGIIRTASEAGDVIAAHRIECISNIELIKDQSQVETELELFTQKAILYKEKRRKLTVSTLKRNAIVSALLVATSLITLGIAIGQVMVGTMQPAVLVPITQYVYQLATALLGIWSNIDQTAKHLIDVNMAIELLYEEDTIKEPINPPHVSFSGGEVAFRDVTFGYAGHTPLFNRFNLTIPGGHRIGLVGLTGAGKSTLVKLLLGQLPYKGKITIDGHNILAISQKQLSEAIAYAPQLPGLLNRTFDQNIRLGCANVIDEEVLVAAKAAQIHELISTQLAGYHTVVGDRGIKLSGGERQRVAIARALLKTKSAKILILDEATSALDAITERAIQMAIDNLKELTIIVVAHRLSTVKGMDKIIVLDRGIKEEGSHEELIAQNGIYAQLWQLQS